MARARTLGRSQLAFLPLLLASTTVAFIHPLPPPSSRLLPTTTSLHAEAPKPPSPSPINRKDWLLGLGVVVGGLLPAVGPASAAPPPLPKGKTYLEQIEEALSIKTVRGVWRIREFRDGEELCIGRLKFKGFEDQPNRGTVTYKGCNNRKGRGPWLLKPARVKEGQIMFNARWKVKFPGEGGGEGTEFIYRGDVTPGSNYAKATASILEGEILETVKGFGGGLSEKRVGTFEADLIGEIDMAEKL